MAALASRQRQILALQATRNFITTLVRLEGIPWCAALGRTWHTVRLAPLTWSMDGRTLLLSEERTNTIPIATLMRSLPWLAPSVELLSTSHAIRSAQGWA